MLRPFMALLFILLICIVVLGFARGWLALPIRQHKSGGDKANLNLTIKHDQLHEEADSMTQKNNASVDRTSERATRVGVPPIGSQ